MLLFHVHHHSFVESSNGYNLRSAWVVRKVAKMVSVIVMIYVCPGYASNLHSLDIYLECICNDGQIAVIYYLYWRIGVFLFQHDIVVVLVFHET